jgi:hypothetical protein
MGEWDFMDIFQATSSGVAVNTASYTRTYYCRPSYSPWRNNTQECMKSRSQNFVAGGMSLA